MRHLQLLLLSFFSISVVHADKWSDAEKEIKLLDPSSFKILPKDIIGKLEKRGCKIPQVYAINRPHNVIEGHFANKNQNDWAVLCSVNYSSSVLIFWGGSSRCSSEIEKNQDREWLQAIGNGKIGFSRLISSIDNKQIQEYHEYDKVSSLPAISHEGIDQIFYGKASGVRYCYKGKWINLTGAD